MQVLSRLLLSPHRPKTLASLSQRDRHAVHAGSGVQERADWVIDVLVNVARTIDVLHQVDAIVLQRTPNSHEHVEWLSLIVDRIERGDEVEGLRLCGPVEVAEIDRDEL